MYCSCPTTQLSCGTGGTWKRSPACSSMTRPSSKATVPMPARPNPTCPTLQRVVPTAGPTCSLQRQPGSYVARPIVIPPRLTTSNVPLTRIRVSSGFSKRLRMTVMSSVVMKTAWQLPVLLFQRIKLRHGLPQDMNDLMHLGAVDLQLGVAVGHRVDRLVFLDALALEAQALDQLL